MTGSWRAEHHPVDALRTCVTVGFWLLVAGAAVALGLDLDAQLSS